jgi:hypothetical protein
MVIQNKIERKKIMIDVSDWIIEALKKRGIQANDDGSFDICYFGDKVQHVPDLDTAIRQQKHIIDQQKVEQDENKEIGILMRQFHENVLLMSKMTIKQLTVEKKEVYLSALTAILEVMARKREKLRTDGYTRLTKVYKMLEQGNVPAANVSSQAALDRMRRRWLVNEKVIDRSMARHEALKKLSRASDL